MQIVNCDILVHLKFKIKCILGAKVVNLFLNSIAFWRNNQNFGIKNQITGLIMEE